MGHSGAEIGERKKTREKAPRRASPTFFSLTVFHAPPQLTKRLEEAREATTHEQILDLK